MDIHVLIRPKARTAPNDIIKAGFIQFSEWRGNLLQARTTATLWWKRKYIHARVKPTTSFIELEIPANQIARLLHFGFTVELSRAHEPLVKAEFNQDNTLGFGFQIRINLEKVLAPPNTSADTPKIVVLKKPLQLRPNHLESY